MSTQTLVAKYQALPLPAQKQVEALSAAVQPAPGKKNRFGFDWAGGLEDLKHEFTAVELQHHILELR